MPTVLAFAQLEVIFTDSISRKASIVLVKFKIQPVVSCTTILYVPIFRFWKVGLSVKVVPPSILYVTESILEVRIVITPCPSTHSLSIEISTDIH